MPFDAAAAVMIDAQELETLRARAAEGDRIKAELAKHIDEAAAKAWDSLSRYKFLMFGYWSAIWVHLRAIEGAKRPNPWGNLVAIARGFSGWRAPVAS